MVSFYLLMHKGILHKPNLLWWLYCVCELFAASKVRNNNDFRYIKGWNKSFTKNIFAESSHVPLLLKAKMYLFRDYSRPYGAVLNWHACSHIAWLWHGAPGSHTTQGRATVAERFRFSGAQAQEFSWWDVAKTRGPLTEAKSFPIICKNRHLLWDVFKSKNFGLFSYAFIVLIST